MGGTAVPDAGGVPNEAKDAKAPEANPAPVTDTTPTEKVIPAAPVATEVASA